MAKGNFVLGTTSGSIGDLTTYAREGDQITRRRARVVKNPRTAAQTMNRVIAATIGSAYSHMNAIVDHSFQGYGTKAANMRRFLKVNQQAIRKMLANSANPLNMGSFQAIGQKGLVPFPYVISEGSMPSMTCFFDSGEWNGYPALAVPGLSSDNIPTYEQICNGLGLHRGDQLTFVYFRASDSYNAGVSTMKFGQETTFHFFRIILDPKETNGSDADMSTPLYDSEFNILKPNPFNVVPKFNQLTVHHSAIIFCVEGTDWGDNPCVAFAVIASRREESVWLRSNTVLLINVDYADFPTLADAINASYPDTTGVTDPTKFLNAAQALKV